MVLIQIEKTIENAVKYANDPDVVFLRYGRCMKRSKQGDMVHLSWKMIDSMKISDMKDWIEDPETAIVRFITKEEEKNETSEKMGQMDSL